MFGFLTWLAALGFAYAGEKGKTHTRSKAEQRRAWEEDKTDIDPITGDYTSKHNGLRYDKHGCLKWRDSEPTSTTKTKNTIEIKSEDTAKPKEEPKPTVSTYAELLKTGRDIEDLSNDEYDQLLMAYGRRHEDDDLREETPMPTFDPCNFTALSFKRLTTLSAHAFQIGLVRVEDGKVTNSFFSYLTPMRPISQNLRNRIPDHLLADIDKAPKLEAIWSEVAPYLTCGSILTPSSYPDFSILGYYLEKFDAYPCDMANAYCGTLASYPVKQLLDKGKPLEQFTALDAAREAANALLSGKTYISDCIFWKRSYPKR